MKFDIAAKKLLEHSLPDLLDFFLHIKPKDYKILTEIPQEMVLLPFIPLMSGGIEKAKTAENILYKIPESSKKLDLLSIFIILLSLKDKDLSKEIFERRRAFMIEAPIVDLCLEEGREEGEKKGEKKKALETARKLLEKNYPLEEILEVTGLTKEELKEAGFLS